MAFMKGEGPGFLIVTDDDALAATLGGKLGEWGAKVFRLASEGPGPELPDRKAVDVVLVDVRRDADRMLALFDCIRTRLPFAEAALINSSGNVGAAMKGMQAGAKDELTVPFDTEELRRTVDAASQRSRSRQKKTGRRSLLAVLEQAMSAAAFAQAGEFETALDLLAAGKATQNRQPEAGPSKNNVSDAGKED